jgi:hypothetical protein
MLNLNNKFIVVSHKASISFIIFNRASLDFIKNRGWFYQSTSKKFKKTSSKSAIRLLKTMRKFKEIE